MSLLIKDKDSYEEKISKLKDNPSNNLLVVADFDSTITKYQILDGRVLTSFEKFAQLGGFSKEYMQERNKLYDFYFPLEHSHEISRVEKIKYMDEWWTKHWNLLLKQDTSKERFQKAFENETEFLKEGYKELFKSLENNKVPLIIFSAGLGDSIQELLRKDLKENIVIISNFFIFDEDGKAIDYIKPQITSFTKEENSIKDHPESKRKNVILLGDSLGDPEMVHDKNHDTILRIGFLNKDVEKNKKKFLNAYDIVILNHESFKEVQEIVDLILNN